MIDQDEYTFIPLLRISPFNLPDERRLHMALKAYYDGSGKAHDPQHKFITLAGFSAPEKVWPLVELKWKIMLERYNVSYSHMREMMSGRGEFSKERGWNRGKCVQFTFDFISLLEKFVNERLWGYSCCVSIPDFARAKEEIPYVKDRNMKIEDVCADRCVGNLQFAQKDYDCPRPITLYFDDQEQFLKRIDKVWRSKEGRLARHNKRGWPYQVAALVPVDMREVYPIQAADMLAWIIQRHYAYSDYEQLYEALFSLNHREWFFDYKEIKEKYGNREKEKFTD